MFDQVLSQCEKNVSSLPCCHDDKRICNCYDCLNARFFGNNPDTYDCEKNNNSYVLIYGHSFIKEIYGYLEKSKIIESFVTNNINILSLGCGFCPDYYAIAQYVTDKGLAVNFQYCGLEKSLAWNTTRLPLPNAICSQADLLNPFSFQNASIIMLNKVFSTIYRNGFADKFLSNLIDAIDNSMQQNSILVFNDININDRGRDDFDKNMLHHFNSDNVKRYYTGGYHPFYGRWQQMDGIYSFQSIFFEYRK